MSAFCRQPDLPCDRLGYVNRGGTLDVRGMLFANRCTWAHLTASAAGLLGVAVDTLLTEAEVAAVSGLGDPADLD